MTKSRLDWMSCAERFCSCLLSPPDHPFGRAGLSSWHGLEESRGVAVGPSTVGTGFDFASDVQPRVFLPRTHHSGLMCICREFSAYGSWARRTHFQPLVIDTLSA